MCAVIEVWEVTVKVNVITVGTGSTGYTIISTMVSTIRISAWENEKIDIIKNILDTGVSAGAELVDKSKHKNHSRHLVTMHRGGVEELRLAVGLAVIDANAKDTSVVGSR